LLYSLVKEARRSGRVLFGHKGKGYRDGTLYEYGGAPPGGPVCVSPKIRTEARGAYEISVGFVKGVGVCERQVYRHGLRTNGVVIHFDRDEANGVGPFVLGPRRGRLECFKGL